MFESEFAKLLGGVLGMAMSDGSYIIWFCDVESYVTLDCRMWCCVFPLGDSEVIDFRGGLAGG